MFLLPEPTLGSNLIFGRQHVTCGANESSFL